MIMHDSEYLEGLHPADDWRRMPDLLPNGQINELKRQLQRRYYSRKILKDQVAAAVGWTPVTPEQEKAAAIEYAALVAQRCRERTMK